MHDIHQRAGFPVEIHPGKVDLFATRTSVGSSIGSDGDPETTGTLGGFVNLIDGKEEVVAECALTSEHIIRPYLKAADAKEMARLMAGFSGTYLYNDAAEKPPIYCFSPSPSAHLEDVSHSKRQLIRLDAEILAYNYANDKEAFPRGK